MSAPLPCRIPWRDVVMWCEWHGYTDDEAEFLDTLLGEMDGEFRAWLREQQGG